MDCCQRWPIADTYLATTPYTTGATGEWVRVVVVDVVVVVVVVVLIFNPFPEIVIAEPVYWRLKWIGTPVTHLALSARTVADWPISQSVRLAPEYQSIYIHLCLSGCWDVYVGESRPRIMFSAKDVVDSLPVTWSGLARQNWNKYTVRMPAYARALRVRMRACMRSFVCTDARVLAVLHINNTQKDILHKMPYYLT